VSRERVTVRCRTAVETGAQRCHDALTNNDIAGVVRRRDIPLAAQCREGLEYVDCFKDVLSEHPDTSQYAFERHVLQLNENLYKLVCVDYFDALKDHLHCLFSNLSIYDMQTCFNSHPVVNCSTTESFQKCFNAAVDRTPDCSPRIKPLLNRLINKVQTFQPNCQIVDSEEEQDEQKVSVETYEREFEKNGVLIKLQLQMSTKGGKDKDNKKNKKKKSGHVVPNS